MEYGDDTAAYVASYVWLVKHGSELAAQFREEILDQGHISREEWNAACDGLAAFARRKGTGNEPADFAAAML